MLNHCSGADLTQVKYGFIPISLSVLFYFHVCSCWTAATWMAQLSPWKVSSVKKKSWAAWRSHCKNPSRYLIENLFLYHTGIDDTLHDFRLPNPPSSLSGGQVTGATPQLYTSPLLLATLLWTELTTLKPQPPQVLVRRGWWWYPPDVLAVACVLYLM